MFKQMQAKITLGGTEISHLCQTLAIGRKETYRRISIGNINTNYYVKTDKGEFVLRFYSQKTLKEIREEHRLLRFLHKNHFPTPVPVKDQILRYKGRWVGAFEYVRGKHLRKLYKHDLKEIAQTTAILHSLTRRYEFGNIGEDIGMIRKSLSKKKKELIDSGFNNAKSFCSFLRSELENIRFPTNLPKGVVHVDIKDENVIFYKHHFETLLDFDNAYRDHLVVDIGSCLLWWCTDAEGLDKSRANLFIHEYQKKRKMGVKEKSNINKALLFNALKQAFKYAYICLPKKKYAEKKAYSFIRIYDQLKRQNV